MVTCAVIHSDSARHILRVAFGKETILTSAQNHIAWSDQFIRKAVGVAINIGIGA